MKVLYDSQAFDMQTHGGVSRCFAELYRHLPPDVDKCLTVRETDNVYLRNLGFPPKNDDYANFISRRNFPMKRILYKAVRNIQAGHIERWDRWPWPNLCQAERALKSEEFDVFHPTYYDDYFLPLLGKKPFVLTVHDMIPEIFPQYYPPTDFQIKRKKRLLPIATHIVAVSEQTKKDIIRLFHIPEEKITVVYHGADQAPCQLSMVSKFDFEYLLYIGERHMYKNFTAFCRDCIPVLQRHKELKVICTGKAFTREEEFFFDAFGMKDRFVHIFFESNQELYDLYHNAIAFAYPSAYEGFGIPILEAYKADCPVMLNHASCFPEIAGDAAVYFTIKDKGEDSDFSDRFEELYSMSASEREGLLAKQRERLKLYSWEKSAETLAGVYRKLA